MIAVPFTRRVSYFHLNVILPLFLIVSVGFSAWAVDRENVDGRLEVRSFEICDTTGLPDRQTRRRVAAASCARVVRMFRSWLPTSRIPTRVGHWCRRAWMRMVGWILSWPVRGLVTTGWLHKTR